MRIVFAFVAAMLVASIASADCCKSRTVEVRIGSLFKRRTTQTCKGPCGKTVTKTVIKTKGTPPPADPKVPPKK